MRIFRYMKKYWYFALLAPLFMVGEVLMDLMQPTLMSIIVDNGINGKEFGDDVNITLQSILTSTTLWGSDFNPSMAIILNTGLLMLFLVFLGGLFGILSGVYTNKAAFKFSNDLRKDAFNHIVHFSYEQTDSFTTGSLVTRLTNDVTQVQNMSSMAMRMLVRSLMQFVLGVVFLLSIKKEFSYVLLVILPIELIIIIFFLIKITPIFSFVQGRVDDVNAVVQENVTGARVVKAYAKEEYEKERFGRANQNLYDINWRVYKIMSWISPLMSVFLSTAMVAVLYLGGSQIYTDFTSGILNGLDVGEVIAAISFIRIILMGFMMLAMMFQSIARGSASIRRLNQVLDTQPKVNSNTDSVSDEKEEGTVEFKNVEFAYPDASDEMILHNINLRIEKGQRIGILGATGCGKSSLVNLIPRFYDALQGTVLVDGVDVKEYELDYLRNKISIALQKSELFTGTIKDNISWGKPDATFEEIEAAAKIAQADDFIKSFNEGYDTVVAEKGASLSGGQKQRISIARALVKKPEILIFDDATSALDLATEAKLYHELNRNLQGTTIIMIAQRVASVRNADKIAILSEGEIIAFDTHDNLIKNCQAYIDIYNSQLKREGEDNE